MPRLDELRAEVARLIGASLDDLPTLGQGARRAWAEREEGKPPPMVVFHHQDPPFRIRLPAVRATQPVQAMHYHGRVTKHRDPPSGKTVYDHLLDDE